MQIQNNIKIMKEDEKILTDMIDDRAKSNENLNGVLS